MNIYYIGCYLIAVIITYYSIRSVERTVDRKRRRTHIWEWKDVLIYSSLSFLFPIIGILIEFLMNIETFVKLPKNPPKWL